MSTSTGGNTFSERSLRGGRRRGAGRKVKGGQRHVIALRETAYTLWREIKDSDDKTSKLTDSDFCLVLLTSRALEGSRSIDLNEAHDNNCSTPKRKLPASKGNLFASFLSNEEEPSKILDSSDVSTEDACDRTSAWVFNSTLGREALTNSFFSLSQGNPFMNEGSDTDSQMSDRESLPISTNSSPSLSTTDETKSVHSIDHPLASAEISAILNLSNFGSSEEGSDVSESVVQFDDLEDDRFLPCDGNTASESPVEAVPSINAVLDDSKASMLLEQVERRLSSLLMPQSSVEEDIANRRRVLVTVEKLRELKGAYCTEMLLCSSTLTFGNLNCRGSVVEFAWSCENKHCGSWKSSEALYEQGHNGIFVNDMLFCSSILLSGNHFQKIALFCKALNLQIPTKTAFCNVQKLYTAPAILSFWEEVRANVTESLQNVRVCLAGDGCNDSPGHSAKYCAYVLMEQFSKAIVDFQVTDKRETKGNSCMMEVFGLRKLLEKLCASLQIEELTTDASTSVTKIEALADDSRISIEKL